MSAPIGSGPRQVLYCLTPRRQASMNALELERLQSLRLGLKLGQAAGRVVAMETEFAAWMQRAPSFDALVRSLLHWLVLLRPRATIIRDGALTLPRAAACLMKKHHSVSPSQHGCIGIAVVL